MNLLEAMGDKNLFAPWFRSGATWAAWKVFVCALFALNMTDEQSAIYKQCTGRTAPPTTPATEAWLICGRRAGKSLMLALVAVFLATFFSYRKHLAPGERGTVLVIATNGKQARVILRYIRGFLTYVPMLARLVERETAEAFDLNNGTTIEVHAASFRSVRGYSIICCLLDEVAFWPTDDAAEPDYEILNALRPGMATIPGAMLLCASSPYARRGSLWDAYRKHHGKDNDPILVWRAATRTMNPTVKQSIIDEASERDPASAAAEYGAEFRTDIESFISREAIEACISYGTRERAPMERARYSAFVDPSGGSADSFTLAVAHKEDGIVILDCIRERRPPFSPEAVVAEFAQLLQSYHITRISGDRYAGEWPREQFRKFGINYEPAQKPKGDLYRDLLPLINSRKIELLDDARLLTQLVGLERRSARSGKDSIDHAPGAHDDIANALAGVAAATHGGKYRYDSTLSWVSGPGDEVGQRLSQHILQTGGYYCVRRWL